MPRKIIQIIREREELINSVPDYFIKKLEGVQNRLYRELLALVKGMDVTKNKLDSSRLNIKLVNRSRLEVARWLRDAGYYEAITDFGKKYQDLIDKADAYYNALGFEDGFLKRDLETLSKVKKNDLDFLTSRDRDVINATYDELMNGVYHHSDWRDLAERLKTMHTDTVFDNGKQLNGLLKKYAATYANTAYAAFDRRIQNIKSEQYGLDKFLYSGSLIVDSRDFCKQRVGKVFTRKEIDLWQNLSWRGKAANRDVWTFLGGFNCRHILSPVTDEMAGEIKKNEKRKRTNDKRQKIKKEAADDFERKVRRETIKILANTNNRFEQGVVFDKDGNVILSKFGKKNKIEFTPNEINQIKNAKLMIHNHPESSSLSDSDILFARIHKIEEIRAIAPKSYFGNVEYYARISESININHFRAEFNRIYSDTYSFFLKLLREGKITRKDAGKLHLHYVWKLMRREFKEFDYGFKRFIK